MKRISPTFDDMISVSVGLVTVDEDSTVIQLVHYTTPEFLENLPDWASTAHLAITRTCLTYLAFKVFDHYFDANDIDHNTVDAVYDNVYRNHCFFDYASRS